MKYTYVFIVFLNLVININLINTIITRKNIPKLIFIFLESLEALKFGFLLFLLYSEYIANPYFFKWILFIEFLVIPCLFVWINIFNEKKQIIKYFYAFCSVWTLTYFLIIKMSSVRVIKWRGTGYIISMVGNPIYYLAYILTMIIIITGICILNYKKNQHIKYMIIELIIAFVFIIESMLFIFDAQVFLYQIIGELLFSLYIIYLLEKPK